MFLPSTESLTPILPVISSPNLGLAEITLTAPDVEFLPKRVPCGPLSTSILSISCASASAACALGVYIPSTWTATVGSPSSV